VISNTVRTINHKTLHQCDTEGVVLFGLRSHLKLSFKIELNVNDDDFPRKLASGVLMIMMDGSVLGN